MAIDPRDTTALDDKGYALFYGLDNYKQAIPYFDKALAIDPKDKYALADKGTSLNGLGKYKEAIPFFDKALAIDPNYTYASDGKQLAISGVYATSPATSNTNCDLRHALC